MTADNTPLCRVELFGPLRLILPDGSALSRFRRQKAVTLLAFLALHSQRSHSRERLVDMLWPDADLEAGRASLSTTLNYLRNDLGAAGSAIAADRQNIGLVPGQITTDAADFDTLLKRACSDASASQRALLLEQAITLYKGDLLEGHFEDWALMAQTAYRARYHEALLDWAQDLETQQEWEGAGRAAGLALEADPLHEEAVLLLMRMQGRQGRAVAAIETFARFERRLREQLDAEPAQELRQLRERLQRDPDALYTPRAVAKPPQESSYQEAVATATAVAALPDSLPNVPEALSEPYPTNLPLQVTSFIGRQKEIAEVQKLLATTRLMTLTGIGGCGKTRLALQIAAEAQSAYPDGVWLVELAPLSDPTLVAQTVAQALGVREAPAEPITKTLASALKTRQMLLVLDNCEHLLEAAARLADALLKSCPQVKLLISSREVLGIGGERAYRVPSLSAPLPTMTYTPESLSQYDAVRLFMDRASMVLADFAITSANASAVASICHRLDGIPLVIELAAARVRSLPVEQIEARLDQRFQLLTGGSRTTMPRQQSLRALLDWSYDLLNAQEKMLLNRLSVFAGGWTLAAAEQVCCGAGIEDWEMLDLMQSLSDKSLIVYEERGAKARYRFLETVRQYARERLEETGETGEARKRHQDCFLALAEAAEPKLMGVEQGEWLDRLEEEHENLRVALTWYGETVEGAKAVLRLSGALWRFWDVHGHYSEGREWCARALGMANSQEPALERAKVFHGAGVLAFSQSDYSSAKTYYEEGLAICREIGDRSGMAISLNNLGNMANYQGDYASANRYLQESLAIRREIGDRGGIASTLNNLGIAAYFQGDLDSAGTYYKESLGIRRETGDQRGIASALNNLGIVACDQDDYAAAITCYKESLSIHRQIGDRGGIANSLLNLGQTVQKQRDDDAARVYLEESLAITREIGDRHGIAHSLNELGTLSKKQGDDAVARACYEESLGIQREIGDRRGMAISLNNLGFLANSQGDYAPARAYHEESLSIFRAIGDQSGIASALEGLGGVALDRFS